MTKRAQLIVCEKTGTWAATLRWHRGPRAPRFQETRSLIDARAALSESPESVLVVETTAANAEGVVRLLLESHRAWPDSRILVLLAPEIRVLADLFWELGAGLVVTSPRRLELLMRFAERTIAKQMPPDLSTREWVWSRLPWESSESHP